MVRLSGLYDSKFSAASEILITCSINERIYLAFNDGYTGDLPWTARKDERTEECAVNHTDARHHMAA